VVDDTQWVLWFHLRLVIGSIGRDFGLIIIMNIHQFTDVFLTGIGLDVVPDQVYLEFDKIVKLGLHTVKNSLNRIRNRFLLPIT